MKKVAARVPAACCVRDFVYGCASLFSFVSALACPVFFHHCVTEKAAAPAQAENNFAMSAALVALAVIAALLFAASALKK